MSNLIKIEAPELVAIEKSKAAKIKETFEPMAEMLEGFEKEYSDIIAESEKEITKEVTAKAKRLRLDVGKVRIETGKLKDKQKEYIKLEDKAIMGVHNILVWAVKEKEDKLKEIENYFEIEEKKRLEALQAERVEMLSKFVEDAHERNLSSMDCDVWEAYYQTKKKDYNDRVAAEKQAEIDRIEIDRKEALHNERKNILIPLWQFMPEENKSTDFGQWDQDMFYELLNYLKFSKSDYDKEQVEIKAENERLQKEAEEKQKQRLAEQKKAQVEAEEAQKKFDTKLKAEREEKERIENELKTKLEAEQKAIQEAEALKQSELSKGDEAKVEDLITDLERLKKAYSFKSAKNQKMYSNVSSLLTKVVDFINQ